MSTNPTSFRLPIPLPTDEELAKVHPGLPQVVNAIRYLFNGITDLQQANIATNAKIKAAAAPSSTVTSAASGIGAVNNQSGQAAVTVQQSDNGALIVVSHSGSVAVSLNSTVTKPFFTRIKVDSGSGNAILTPTSGTINGAGFISVPAGTTIQAYFNSIDQNWTAS